MAKSEAKKRQRKEARLQKRTSLRTSGLERKNLLTKLKEFQLKPDQLDRLHSTSAAQTKGLKRFRSEQNSVKTVQADSTLDPIVTNKSKRLKKWRLAKPEPEDREDGSSSDSSTCEIQLAPKPIAVQKAEKSQIIENVQPESAVKKEEVVSKQEIEKPVEAKSDKLVEKPEKKPAVYVEVKRDPVIQKSRLELPILSEEHTIMEAIHEDDRDVVIVSGETGSGKTTQIPQFLYEKGYALNGKMIGVTEPRRVAAVSMSERVAKELNLGSDEVSYHIRFSGNVSPNTKIKFMTDGVLLREVQQDFMLSKYSVIIIDEAHERSVFSDILIGFLSRIVTMRRKRGDILKLVIMSATLNVADFAENTYLFKRVPPVINITARQYPVTVHFAKKTPANYLEAAYKKVCRIHNQMPKGGILVFVTSQMDVKVLCNRLKAKFPAPGDKVNNDPAKKKLGNVSRQKQQSNSGKIRLKVDGQPILHDMKDDFDLIGADEEEDFEEEPGKSRKFPEFSNWSDAESDSENEVTVATTKTPLYCLGLYALLPLEKQRLVFQEPPDETRLCVVATNVAETSITIPNIRYVIDTGMEKTKVYDLVTGVSRFETSWTSKSSAQQRTGRAGRMGPGQCYRLYSSAVFTNDFRDFSEPAILQKPVEDVLLQMKAMGIDNVVNFPFPQRPSLEALMSAEKQLIKLGALSDEKFRNARFADMNKTEFASRPTELGKAMARFAVSPRCAKMIVGAPLALVPHVLCLVSALSVREIFINNDHLLDRKKKLSGSGHSRKLADFMVMIKAIRVTESTGCSKKVCDQYGLRSKAMFEIDKLRRQLTHEVNCALNQAGVSLDLKKLSETQTDQLRHLLYSSYCDHVARKIPDCNITVPSSKDPTKTEKKRIRHAYECDEVEGYIYISPESVLRGKHPDLLIYRELYKTEKKTYMRDVAEIEPSWHFKDEK